MKRWLMLLLLLPGLSAQAGEDSLVVENAWVREAPPGARMLAAFMEIRNTGDEAVVLTGVDSPAFDHVMLHRSVVVDGVARMLHQDEIPIPAGTSLKLEPGSYHLMMPAPETRLQSGDQVEFLLHFADDNCLRISADVKKNP